MSTNYGDEPGRLVRPYAVTGGRTRSRRELAIEALVTTTSAGEHMEFYSTPERRQISSLCREVRSVAEIAALLSIPLGVARVLVGDLADEGLVRVHQPANQQDHPDLALLEKVLSGLRKL